MAGILARMPAAGLKLIKNAKLELGGLSADGITLETLIILAVLFVAVVVGVVFITLGQRRPFSLHLLSISPYKEQADQL